MNRRTFVQAVGGMALAAAAQRIAAGAEAAEAKPGPGRVARFGDGRDWFFEKRFGMFVHWGLYAIPGWHEQHQWRGRMARPEYVKLAARWNPVKFNPDQWLDLLQATGIPAQLRESLNLQRKPPAHPGAIA